MPLFRSVSWDGTLSATASWSCSAPAGVIPGDILVLCHLSTAALLTDMGTPTGGAAWNLLDSSTWPNYVGYGGGVKLWWKIAAAGEPGAYGLTQDSNAYGSCSIVCVQDPNPVAPVVAHVGDSVSATSIPTPSTTPNGASDFEIRFATARSGSATFTPPAGFTERVDFFVSPNLALQSCATRTLTSSAATGVQNFTASASLSSYVGFTVNIGSTAASRFAGWGVPLR